MANEPVYECTQCGQATARDLLVVKKISFLEMGVGGRTLRSRVSHWLCPRCVSKDSEYNLEPFSTPGHRRVKAGSEIIG